jgi:hypothetical protein
MRKNVIVRKCTRVALLLSIAGTPTLGARAQHPAPPKDYLPVEVTPPGPAVPAMTQNEQSKLKTDLAAARDRQATGVKGKHIEKHMERKKP